MAPTWHLRWHGRNHDERTIAVNRTPYGPHFPVRVRHISSRYVATVVRKLVVKGLEGEAQKST
jgi:hypothetical protein